MKKLILFLFGLITFTSCYDHDKCTYEYKIEAEIYYNQNDTIRNTFTGTFTYYAIRNRPAPKFFAVDVPEEGIKICYYYSTYNLKAHTEIPIGLDFIITSSEIKCIKREPLE